MSQSKRNSKKTTNRLTGQQIVFYVIGVMVILAMILGMVMNY